MMCDLFYACSYEEVSNFLTGLGLFVFFTILAIGMTWAEIEKERSKRSGVDIQQIDKIINDARKRAYERGRDDYRT
jgi:hypothetical protein